MEASDSIKPLMTRLQRLPNMRYAILRLNLKKAANDIYGHMQPFTFLAITSRIIGQRLAACFKSGERDGFPHDFSSHCSDIFTTCATWKWELSAGQTPDEGLFNCPPPSACLSVIWLWVVCMILILILAVLHTVAFCNLRKFFTARILTKIDNES